MLVSTPARDRLRTGIALNLAALVLLAAYVLFHAYPSTEAVRLRNSLLIHEGAAADFDWKPSRIPGTFLVDQGRPLPDYAGAVRASGAGEIADDSRKALALAAILTRNAGEGGAIRADLATTLRAITEEGRGYCADFTKAYLGLAYAAGLAAREWAFSFDGFGGHGHTLVEVFDRRLDKWVFLDVFNNVYAVDAASGEPLSAIEFRDFVLGRRAAPRILPIGPGRPGYEIEEKLLDYYRRGAGEWYLWKGNNVFTYDAHPAVRAAGRVSDTLAQMVAVVTGIFPRIAVLPAVENAPQMAHMVQLRRILLAIAVLMALLVVALAWQLANLAAAHAQRPVSTLRGGANDTRYAD